MKGLLPMDTRTYSAVREGSFSPLTDSILTVTLEAETDPPVTFVPR